MTEKDTFFDKVVNFLAFESWNQERITTICHTISFFYISRDIYIYFNEIMHFLCYLFTGTIFISTSFLISVLGLNMVKKAFLSMFTNKEVVKQYDDFIYKYDDAMREIFENPDVKSVQYEWNDKDYLISLKRDKEKHKAYSFPFDCSHKVIMYYDLNRDTFHYYTTSYKTNYDILNTICRCYVIENRCVQLFKDDYDLNRILECNNEKCQHKVNKFEYKGTLKEYDKHWKKKELRSYQRVFLTLI